VPRLHLQGMAPTAYGAGCVGARRQLLAHALERHRAEGADRVRVLHVTPQGNEAYQDSLRRPEQRALGAGVAEVWQRLLRRPDRFTSVDSGVFLDPAVTSRQYVLRYGDPVRDEPGLLAAVGVDSSSLSGAPKSSGTANRPRSSPNSRARRGGTRRATSRPRDVITTSSPAPTSWRRRDRWVLASCTPRDLVM
jgi:hypothetical protein